MITRRRVMLALGDGALAPIASFAQQGKVWRVGFLGENEPSISMQNINAFRVGMSELGYSESRDYMIEHRYAQGDLARLPALAVELVALKVDVILTTGTPSTVAASKATRDIPILIETMGDPVGIGVAASLARPGGNVTGLTGITPELISRRLDLLRQLLPELRRVGFLYNPNNQIDASNLVQFEVNCGKLQLQPIRAPARKTEEIAVAFMILTCQKAQGLVVTGIGTNIASRKEIIELAAKHRLPTTYGQNVAAEEGGLFSYATDDPDLFRRVAAYADKIFKGAKPGDLPIERPTRFDFFLNIKTAKSLGIKIPNSILVQATKVIE